MFGLKSLHSDAFSQFRAEAGGLAVQFRTDCDGKLFSAPVVRWLQENNSNIISAPAGRQSANGLVERQWRTMVEMARSFLTEKQMPRAFWFYAIQHAARMMNCIPGKVHDELTTPFELVHHVPPDSRTWFPLFCVGFFNHTRDGSTARSSFQAQTLEGIAVGRSTTSNAMIFYNPATCQYYEPDSYKFDHIRLPSTVWPKDIVYDGGIFADLYRGNNPHVPEPFPPGTRVSVTPTDGSTTLMHGTVSTIPLKHDDGSTDTNTYMVILDDGSTVSTALSNLALVSAPPTSPDLANASLPSFLSHGNKVSMFHNDNYHRGFILHQPDGTFRFSCKPRINTKLEEWGLDLPNLPADWPSMCQNDTLLPSWVIHTAAKPISTGARASVSARLPTIEEPLCVGSVSHVSARNLKNPCPSSLLQALEPDNVDRDVWAASYNEEKDALKGANTFTVIDLARYQELRKAGAPRAIPTMCILVIKPNEKFEPDRAKSRVVVLGNLDDRPWCKHERAAPVMKYSSFRLTVSSAIAVKR